VILRAFVLLIGFALSASSAFSASALARPISQIYTYTISSGGTFDVGSTTCALVQAQLVAIVNALSPASGAADVICHGDYRAIGDKMSITVKRFVPVTGLVAATQIFVVTLTGVRSR
jgi:hypothetical protein